MSLNVDPDDPAAHFELTPEQYLDRMRDGPVPDEVWESLSASFPNVQLQVADPNDYSLEEAIEENERWEAESA